MIAITQAKIGRSMKMREIIAAAYAPAAAGLPRSAFAPPAAAPPPPPGARRRAGRHRLTSGPA